MRCAIDLRHVFGTTPLDRQGRMKQYFPSFPGLPLRPIWPGFVLNAALIAAAVFALWSALALWARWRGEHRLARGLCPYCVYPSRGLEVCPECGRTVPRYDPAHQGRSEHA